MDQELDKIIGLLEDISSLSVIFSNNTDKLITAINSKINLLKHKSASALSKAYNNELFKSFENTVSTISTAFSTIEKSLKNIYITKKEIENSDNQYDIIISKNLHDLIDFEQNTKPKFKEFTKDKENISQNYANLIEINHAFNETLKNSLNDLTSIFANLNDFDWNKKKSSIKKDFETIEKTLLSVQKQLQAEDKKNSTLEKLIYNTITDEKLKLSSGMVDSIIEKTNNISKSIQKNNPEKEIDHSVLQNILYKTDELISFTNDIKQVLGKITRNIEALPDTSILERNLQNIYSRLEDISSLILENKIHNNFELNSKITFIKEDFSTVKNIVTDLNEVLISKIDNSILDVKNNSIKELISKIVLSSPKKEDIKHNLKKASNKEEKLSKIVKNNTVSEVDASITTEDFESLNTKETTNYENWLANPGNNNEDLISRLYQKNIDIDKDFHNKFENLRKDILSSQKETENKLLSKLDNFDIVITDNADIDNIKNNLDETKKEIIESQIANKDALLDKLSELNNTIENNTETSDFSTELQELKEEIISGQKETEDKLLNEFANINQKPEIELPIDEIKEEFLNIQNSNQNELLDKLSELSNSIENNAVAPDFSTEFQELKDEIINSQKEGEEKLLSKLANIDNEINNNIKIEDSKNEIINTQTANQDVLINRFAELTTLIESNLQAGDFFDFTEELNTLISDIFAQFKNNIEKSIDNKKEIINSVEKYFTDVKEFITESQPEPDIELKNTISSIENQISEFKNANNELFDKVIEKIDTFENFKDKNINLEECIQSSSNEIFEIKTQIENLGKTFENIKSNNEQETNIKNFVSEKLSELGSDINKLENCITDIPKEIYEQFENSVQKGFSYNSELIEEKYTMLLEFIKELRHASTDNIELFERLTVTDNKLMDFKQELELVNTDITSILNSKSEEVIETIKSIKEALEQAPHADNQKLELILEEIKNLSNKTPVFIDDNNDSESEDKTNFDILYKEISQKLNDTKDKIRDFLLGDIDSVIIKVDNIKDYLTDKLDSIVPPNPEEMKELNKFVSQIAEFKKENENYLKRIETSINEKHEELKSMLTVALNNKEILKAIEKLKECFKSKINDFEISEDSEDDIFEEEDIDSSDNQELVNDLKDDFGKIADQIDTLSGQNSDIEYILNNIYDKIDSIRLEKDNEDKKLIGENDFDFIKAFDLLSEDIKNLKSSVSKVLQDGDKKFSLGAETAYTKISSRMEEILTSTKNEWLEEIKNYLSNNELKTIVNDINNKIDILALTSNQSDSGSVEVKKLLDVLNAKVDILAQNDSFAEIDDLRTSIEELTQRLDNINIQSHSSGNDENIEDIKNSIDSLNFDNQDNNKEIRDIVETLNDKIDSIAFAETSGINEVQSESSLQIKSMLETLNNKLDIIAQSDNYEQIEELSDSDMQITSMLETLNHKIDILAQTELDIETDEHFEDIKQLILAQQDYIDKLEPSKKIETFKKCLEELSSDVNSLSFEKNEEIHKTLKDMKESIMDAVVNIFNQVSFAEETEDIKDFVEEKTEKIAKNLEEVTKQIKQLAFSDESEDYNYSMQDIETDLAKLRIALNELKNNANLNQTGSELTNIADTLNRITSTVDSLSQDEIQELKSDITNLKEQTHQLLMSSDASFSTINNDIVYKVDNVTQMLEKSNDSDKVMRQALIYMGEWIDSASESMNKISSNSDEIINIKSTIENRFDDQQEHLNFVEKQITKLENLESRFEQQEARIDRLEENLDKILSVVEDIDNSGLMRKVDKIDKQLTKLSLNIEKLTSYVD